VVQAVLVEPLPYPEPDRLTVFWAEWRDRGIDRLSHTGNDFREYQRETTLFEGIAALGSLRQNLGGVAEPVQVQVGWISENFFRVMKVSPALGRDFTDHEPPGSVILGYGIWQSQFAGAPEVLGRVVELDETPFTVVGVLPRGFRLWHAADVGIAMVFDAVALATILGATLLLGLLPAIRNASPDLRRFLSRRGAPPSASRRLTEVLVVSEIAISLALLVGAGLLLRSFVALREIRPGFDSGGLLTFSISLPSRSYPAPVATWEFLKRLEKRLTELPGVASAGTVWPLPLEGQKFFGYYRTTDVATEEGTLPVADFRISSPAYLETMGARLLSGRYLREDDSNAVVVDRTLAERNWPDGKALGQKVWVQPESAPVEMQVVGVAENVRHADLTRDGRETIYLPAQVFAWSDFELALVVRASDPEAQVAPVRKALAELDPKIPMAKVKTADAYVEDAMAANRLAFLLAALFAGAALLLSGVGLYGVMAYGFERHRREMGLRMALGAGRTAVAALVLGNGFKLALRGIGIGAGGTYLLRGSLAGLLYGVEPSDPWTLGTVAGVVGLTSLAGSLGPLRRALRVDPSTALRSE
jgi:predicted permease